MARGNKNYFRHYNEARRDSKIMSMIDKYGKESYFHYFAIVELCASQAENQFPDDSKFKFHIRTLASELLLKRFKVLSLLESMQNEMLLKVESKDNNIEIELPNLSKYMGRYESKCTLNVPNKSKVKEKKVNVLRKRNSHTEISCDEDKKLNTLYFGLEELDEVFKECAKKLSEDEQRKLVESYGLENVKNILEKIASWSGYPKKVNSVYMTAINWMKKDGIMPTSKKLLDFFKESYAMEERGEL